jgi:molybdopterin/thiamine biosynthesis adenylyltransferase
MTRSAVDTPPPGASADERQPSIVVAGLGNIGSHSAQHVARTADGARVTLIDRDVYEAKNVCSQDITPRDVGRAKAAVQARRLRRINPAIHVTACADAVEHVPLGVFRGAIVLGCLDSRAARRHLAAAAWQVGAVAYIDAGVEPTGMLARVNVYVGGADAPCYECAWQAVDYAAQEQRYPCDVLSGSPASSSPAATNAPSSLGALAAALQAVECHKLLHGRTERVLVGRQIVIDASWHKHYVTALRRNPDCRFDHRVWQVEALPAATSVGALFALGGVDCTVRVPGHTFVRRLCCIACGRSRTLLRLSHRLSARLRRCAACGHPMQAAGFDMLASLRRADLPDALLRRPPRSLGLLAGDVIALGAADGERYFQLGTGN